MKKLVKHFALVSVGLIVSVAWLIVLAIGWYVWQLHPWIKPGKAVDLGHWRFGDHEFEVWQRKNVSILEPFTDGLFVQKSTNKWETFDFDIQDRYSPRVRLEKENSRVVVYCDGQKRGVYDLASEQFQRHDQPFAAGYIVGKPPGDWLLTK